MGADFTFQTIPVFNPTPERIAALLAAVHDADLATANIEREQAVEAIQGLPDTIASREVSTFWLEHGPHSYITGGMSWGDYPTEAYGVFQIINDLDALCPLMEAWHNEDAKAGDKPVAAIVAVEGGLVQSISSRDPAMIGRKVRVIDYDVEGSDEADLMNIPQPDGMAVPAVVHEVEVEPCKVGDPMETKGGGK